MSALIERAARMGHEANRAYCVMVGDDSQLSWEDAPEWQKESARNGVKFLVTRPNAKPRDSHDAWMKEKEEQGWKHGGKKDVDAKTHPAMVPYEALPVEQRIKDYIFVSTVRASLVITRSGHV